MDDTTTTLSHTPAPPASPPSRASGEVGIAHSDQPVTHIGPRPRWVGLDLPELWDYRELLYFLVVRDLSVRYRQTALGASWAILQPLLAMGIFTLFFSRYTGSGHPDLPYPVFCLAGLVPWTFFAQSLARASPSLVISPNLVRKVYFPRLILPAASVIGSVADLACSGPVLVLMMAGFGIWPHWGSLLLLPMPVLLAVVTAMGMAFWFAALNAGYRDLQHVLPYTIQLWLFATPVIYPANAVTSRLSALGLPEWIYGLNPMAGAVEGFRVAVLGTGVASVGMLVASAVVAGVILITGALYFRRNEKLLVDVL